MILLHKVLSPIAVVLKLSSKSYLPYTARCTLIQLELNKPTIGAMRSYNSENVVLGFANQYSFFDIAGYPR